MSRISLVMLAACGALALAGDLSAQDSATQPSVAFIGVAFDGAHANSIQPGDSGTALQAADRMRAVIQETSGVALVDTARVSAEVRKVELPGIACSSDVACARRVGRALGAKWVAVGRLRKVSNLIWYLSGQLVEVESGRVALNDELELKGPRDEMLPRGAASLARRMARTAIGELGTSSSRD